MAHAIDFTTGKPAMAFVGDRKEIWHGLGQELTKDASIETWKREAGMDWTIESAPVLFNTPEGVQNYKGQRVLYRGDSQDHLSIVSDGYKVVQPGEVLEFFRDLVEDQGMSLNTAGVLFGGRRFWALADTGREIDVLGSDRVKGMILLTTSCDGTLATNAMFTSVRVCCANTLSIALNSESQKRVRVTHRSEFDPSKIKDKMGLIDSAWGKFVEQITDLSNARILQRDAEKFVYNLFAAEGVPAEDQPYTVAKNVNNVLARYNNGMGTNMANGTLWGILNAVTEHIDHDTAHMRAPDAKLWGTWYGKGANIKTKAIEQLLEMV